MGAREASIGVKAFLASTLSEEPQTEGNSAAASEGDFTTLETVQDKNGLVPHAPTFDFQSSKWSDCIGLRASLRFGNTTYDAHYFPTNEAMVLRGPRLFVMPQFTVPLNTLFPTENHLLPDIWGAAGLFRDIGPNQHMAEQTYWVATASDTAQDTSSGETGLPGSNGSSFNDPAVSDNPTAYNVNGHTQGLAFEIGATWPSQEKTIPNWAPRLSPFASFTLGRPNGPQDINFPQFGIPSFDESGTKPLTAAAEVLNANSASVGLGLVLPWHLKFISLTGTIGKTNNSINSPRSDGHETAYVTTQGATLDHDDVSVTNKMQGAYKSVGITLDLSRLTLPKLHFNPKEYVAVYPDLDQDTLGAERTDPITGKKGPVIVVSKRVYENIEAKAIKEHPLNAKEQADYRTKALQKAALRQFPKVEFEVIEDNIYKEIFGAEELPYYASHKELRQEYIAFNALSTEQKNAKIEEAVKKARDKARKKNPSISETELATVEANARKAAEKTYPTNFATVRAEYLASEATKVSADTQKARAIAAKEVVAEYAKAHNTPLTFAEKNLLADTLAEIADSGSATDKVNELTSSYPSTVTKFNSTGKADGQEKLTDLLNALNLEVAEKTTTGTQERIIKRQNVTGYLVAIKASEDAAGGAGFYLTKDKGDCDDTHVDTSSEDSCRAEQTYYQDNDHDGFGNPEVTKTSRDATAPAGYSTKSLDCDDSKAAIHPNSADLTADSCVAVTLDFDNDTHGDLQAVTNPDGFSAHNPSLPLQLSMNASQATDSAQLAAALGAKYVTSVGDDCNDNNNLLALSCDTFYQDQDGDGYGVESATREGPTEGFVNQKGDCNDADANSHPISDKPETLECKDLHPDTDSDTYGALGSVAIKWNGPRSGYVEDATDCNDKNAKVHPGAAEPEGSTVDMNCDNKLTPKVLVKWTNEKIEITEKVFFDFNKSTIQSRSDELLRQVAAIIIAHPYVRNIDIRGYTDKKGSDDYNQKLSQARSESVRQRLIDLGVDPAILTPIGFGEQGAVVPESASDAKREGDRKVEFIITKQDPETIMPASRSPEAGDGASTDSTEIKVFTEHQYKNAAQSFATNVLEKNTINASGNLEVRFGADGKIEAIIDPGTMSTSTAQAIVDKLNEKAKLAPTSMPRSGTMIIPYGADATPVDSGAPEGMTVEVIPAE